MRFQSASQRSPVFPSADTKVLQFCSKGIRSDKWFGPVVSCDEKPSEGLCASISFPNWVSFEKCSVKVLETVSMEIKIVTTATGYFEKYMVSAVVYSTSTSHCLQKFVHIANENFEPAMQKLRDTFCSEIFTGTRRVNYNLACGVHTDKKMSIANIAKILAFICVHSFQHNSADHFHRKKQ